MYNVHLILRKLEPENQEFPMIAQSEWITPEPLFYIRNHFSYPTIDVRTWRLSIEGCVNQPILLRYSDLFALPQVTMPVTLECSGNKRALFEPKTKGEQWELGGISHAEWTGVPLWEVLKMTGIRSEAKEIVFEGMDVGPRTDLPGHFSYTRSLPREKALHPHTLLVIAMNGKPLPLEHGFPLRVIVPGWYGMASVKWLHRIMVLDHPFEGPFQKLDYVLITEPDQYENALPVTEVQVNSTIAYPSDQEIIRHGRHLIRGVAWSGHASVVDIQVSTDGGVTWKTGTWIDPMIAFSWRRWVYEWDVTEPGVYRLMVKATDDMYRSQPIKALWNVKGYINNSVHAVTVYVD